MDFNYCVKVKHEDMIIIKLWCQGLWWKGDNCLLPWLWHVPRCMFNSDYGGWCISNVFLHVNTHSHRYLLTPTQGFYLVLWVACLPLHFRQVMGHWVFRQLWWFVHKYRSTHSIWHRCWNTCSSWLVATLLCRIGYYVKLNESTLYIGVFITNINYWTCYWNY